MNELDRKTVRWKQRYANLGKAFALLEEACLAESLNRLEEEGLVQRFEFTWELSWNTLKDYLESKGIAVQFPRDTIKESFATGLVRDGEVWMDMILARNIASHRYDEKIFFALVDKIRTQYYPALKQMVDRFRDEASIHG